jgi:ABC-type Zn uptake system ZnuABC Zn-binding protein ZnuA
VCATVYPLADVVREIGGPSVRLDWILDLGDPVYGYALSREDRDRMTGIDLLLCAGTRSEAWAQSPILSLEDTGRVISLEQLEIVRTAPATGLLWLDPMIVRDAVPVIAEQLGRRLPRQAEDLRARGQAYAAKLDDILRKHPDSAFGPARVIVTERSFDPLLDRFGIDAVLVDASPLSMAATDYRRLQSKAAEEKIGALLLPFDTPAGAVQDIEQRTGLRVFLLDYLGLPNYPGHGTYLELLEYNLAQLQLATQPITR